MRYPGGSELPEHLQDLQRKAVRLEWITIAYLLSAITAIFFTLGSSQAMKGPGWRTCSASPRRSPS